MQPALFMSCHLLNEFSISASVSISLSIYVYLSCTSFALYLSPIPSLYFCFSPSFLLMFTHYVYLTHILIQIGELEYSVLGLEREASKQKRVEAKLRKQLEDAAEGLAPPPELSPKPKEKERDESTSAYRNEIQNLKRQLQHAHVALEKELGESTPVSLVLSLESQWVGRAQQITMLKAKVRATILMFLYVLLSLLFFSVLSLSISLCLFLADFSVGCRAPVPGQVGVTCRQRRICPLALKHTVCCHNVAHSCIHSYFSSPYLWFCVLISTSMSSLLLMMQQRSCGPDKSHAQEDGRQEEG